MHVGIEDAQHVFEGRAAKVESEAKKKGWMAKEIEKGEEERKKDLASRDRNIEK